MALNLSSVDHGAQVFSVHCAGCHVNGGNIVRRGKNLKLKTLQRHHIDSLEAIGEIVANGRGIMSAYGDRLSEQEITDVSAYVLQQAEQGWKNK
ncbi:c-type cytochrome [Thermocoleostomius sinensis]|nr:c-type cytochrome [Thermocoleostomius sinensis]